VSKPNFTLASQRNPALSSYSDNDIQNQYAAADGRRQALIFDYDNGKATDADLDAIDSVIFALDDELCARGL